MRKLATTHLIWSLSLSPVLWHLLGLIAGTWSFAPPETPALEMIESCAGRDTTVEVCTYCSDRMGGVINLMQSLAGAPIEGGRWYDDDGAGVDLSDSTQVSFVGVPEGEYDFLYTLPAGMSCPADTAILRVSVQTLQGIACIDTINVTLNEDCRFPVNVGMLLAGTSPCDTALRFVLFDENNRVIGDTITPQYAGTVINFGVFLPGCSAIACSGMIQVADVDPPAIDSVAWLPDSVQLLCSDLNFILNNERSWLDPNYKYYLGGPIFKDNCTDFRLSVNDFVVYGDCDTAFAKLYRTFFATDAFGNAVDTVLCAPFYLPDPAMALKVPDVVINTCRPDRVEVPATYPFMINHFGDSVRLDENGCDFGIGFEDRFFEVCGNSRKVERFIKWFDWCKDTSFVIDTVIIKIGDFEAPVVLNNTDTFRLSTGPFDCTAALAIGEAELEAQLGVIIQDCNPNVQITGELFSYLPIPGPFGNPTKDSSFQLVPYPSTGNIITGIPPGLHRLAIVLADGCKASATDTIYFRVRDGIPPVLACIDGLNVSMNEGPYARVFGVDINEGSYDNCGPLELKVRRYVHPQCYPNFDYNENGKVLGDELDEDGYTRLNDSLTNGHYIEYYCCDLLEPNQKIQLVGIDKKGNKNTCWSNILLEDKRPPKCFAPNDTTIICNDSTKQFLQLLDAVPQVNGCGNVVIRELPSYNEVDKCGSGQVIRRWRAVKNPDTDQELVGDICRQVVTIEAEHNYYICFPEDTEAGCQEDPDIPGLSYDQTGCDLIAVQVEDETYVASNDECYKILRTYTIINWCEYRDQPYPLVISRDMDEDGRPGDEKICVIVRPQGTTYYDRDNNEKNIIPTYKGFWTNSEENPDSASIGYWQYTQHIKVYDDTPPQLQLDSAYEFCSQDERNRQICSGPVNISFSVVETCNDFLDLKVYLDPFEQETDRAEITRDVLQGRFPNYNIQTSLPIGKHRLVILANDGCGNTISHHLPVEVKDCKAPAPLCTSGIAVTMVGVLEEDSIEAVGLINVDNLLASPIYDCSGQLPGGLIIDYSVSRVGDAPVRGQRSIPISCADVGQSLSVEVSAWDEAGNRGACRTTVEIQDNQMLCTGGITATGMIAGGVHTIDGRSVQEVEVQLSGARERQIQTDPDGGFMFEDLPEGTDYTLRARRDEDYRNGVSTFDLIMIQKHILGVDPFTSPYQLIAADVNASGSISTLDIVQMRKLILNISTTFSQSPSWRFLDAAYEFPDPNNPWLEPLPESTEIHNMGETNYVDFMAVKIGDVNNSAIANSFQSDPEVRNGGVLVLNAADHSFAAGEKVKVAIMPQNLEEVTGFQYTLEFDTDVLSLDEVHYDLLGPGNMGFFPEKGMITHSWHREDLQFQIREIPLYTIEFRALQGGTLKEVLKVNTELTKAEAYTVFGELMDVQIHIGEEATGHTGLLLYQNSPNPFRNTTKIAYYLPGGGTAKLEVFDPAGRKVWQEEGRKAGGLHEFSLLREQFPSKGVYFYRLQYAGERLTRRLIVQ